MVKYRIYRNWLLDLKGRLPMRRMADSCISPPLDGQKELGQQEELDDQVKDMEEYAQMKTIDEICALADKRFIKAHVKDHFQALLERNYKDDVMMHTWMIYHTVHSIISYTIGSILLFLATALIYSANTDPVSDENFEELSYAIELLLIALLANNVVGVYLMLFSFADDGYSDSASELIRKIYQLVTDLTALETSLGVDNDDDISQELRDVMGHIMGGPLYNILQFGLTANSEVIEVIKRIEPVVKDSLKADSQDGQELETTCDLLELSEESTSPEVKFRALTELCEFILKTDVETKTSSDVK